MEIIFLFIGLTVLALGAGIWTFIDNKKTKMAQ